MKYAGVPVGILCLLGDLLKEHCRYTWQLAWGL